MDVFKIANQFSIHDDLVSYHVFGNGHINRTYLVTTKKERYILQRINSYVFKDIDGLMSNIEKTTSFLESKNIETIHFEHTKDGKAYYKDGDDYYRIYKFAEYTMTFEKADGLELVEKAAQAFGKLHNNLADLDASTFVETIPNFHNTPVRYQNFLTALKEDKLDRAKNCQKEIENIKKYADKYSLIVDGIKSGDVKLHVTHNDPKINNALFDTNTYKFRSVIDLDTMMPGSVLYDFGDALRSLFTGENEDSKDYQNVVVDKEIYAHYLKSYYAEAKNFLTKKEIELFPMAPFILTMECGMRFLEDYLKGDVYFHIARDEHNLDRARTQINLANSIINAQDELIKITKEIVGE